MWQWDDIAERWQVGLEPDSDIAIWLVGSTRHAALNPELPAAASRIAGRAGGLP